MPPGASCSEITTDSKIKVEECGRKAVFLNEDRHSYVRTKVDGCLVEGSPASDWVVSRQQLGDVIVELKGTDVSHAITQVTATAALWENSDRRCGALAALIVCSQYPRIATGIQRAKERFKREYRAPLHVVSRNREYRFELVLSFEGP